MPPLPHHHGNASQANALQANASQANALQANASQANASQANASQANASHLHAGPSLALSHADAARIERLLHDWHHGQRAAVELDLHQWAREHDAPACVAYWLAASFAQRRWWHRSTRWLLRLVGRASPIPAEVQLLIHVCLEQGDHARASRWAHWLNKRFGHRRSVSRFVNALPRQVKPADQAVDSHSQQVVRLATHLREAPQLIRPLVQAQQLEPHAEHIRLLRLALTKVLPRKVDAADSSQRTLMVGCCEALAKLAILEHDPDDARRWAHRGLKLDRTHVPLALVLAELPDDRTLGPRAAALLEMLWRKHPNYPDVRRAMIRRHVRDGRKARALRQLRQWQKHQPKAHMVEQLTRELAA